MESRYGRMTALKTALCVAMSFALAFCCLFATGQAAYGAKDSGDSAAKTEKAEKASSDSGKDTSSKGDSSKESSAADSSSKQDSSKNSSSSGKSNMAPGTSDSTKKDKDKDDEDEKKKKEEEEKEKKEKEAEEKYAQASAVYGQIAALDATASKHQVEFEAAQQDRDEATTLRDETNAELEKENESLEELRGELSGFVIDMYKQGGAAPYLDVMLKSTTYREFLTSWQMANEVSQYGEAEIHEKNEVIDALQETVDGYNAKIEEAENAMKKAERLKVQVAVSQLALKAQAASLNLEAAEILEDDDAIADAQGELADANKALDELLAQGVAGESLLSGTGYFTHPCPDATYSSGFGYRSFDNAFHKGLDMAIAEGTPYYAADSGTVTAATNGGGYNGGAGNWVVIDHGDGLVTKYMHSLVTFVQVGDHVERGQNIGLVGNTGNSFGAHLHFQVEVNGVAVNPQFYL